MKLSDQALSVLRREVRAARLRVRRDKRIGLQAPRRVVQLSAIDLPPVVRRYHLARPARPGVGGKDLDICSDSWQAESIQGLDPDIEAPATETPAIRSAKDLEGYYEAHPAVTSPSAPPKRIVAEQRRPRNYRVDENVRRFWLTHTQDFVPFATFNFIFERYQEWVDAQPVGGVYLRNKGLVARHLSNITAESNEWTRVFVSRHCDMAAYNTFEAPPDPQPRPGGVYTLVAYMRNPIGPATEL